MPKKFHSIKVGRQASRIIGCSHNFIISKDAPNYHNTFYLGGDRGAKKCILAGGIKETSWRHFMKKKEQFEIFLTGFVYNLVQIWDKKSCLKILIIVLLNILLFLFKKTKHIIVYDRNLPSVHPKLKTREYNHRWNHVTRIIFLHEIKNEMFVNLIV